MEAALAWFMPGPSNIALSRGGRQHERSAPPEGVSDYKIAGWLGDAMQIVDRS